MNLGNKLPEMGNTPAIRELLTELFAEQRFAVIATLSNEGNPYTNLVAFAEIDSLNSLLFVTARNTRKYSNLMSVGKVAVLVDNRTNQISDVSMTIAVTALGTVEEISEDKRTTLVEAYVSKHPHLLHFINNSANALMKITVTDYVIAKFDGVTIFHVGD